MSEFKTYFNDKFFQYGCFEEKGKNIDDLLNAEMSIICGDFYGIQKFIFEGLVTKNAAKVLRAKSAFVELFTNVVAKFICKELGLDEDRILSSSAGKFEILANSRIPSEKIDRVQGILDEYFIKNFYGISGMSVVCVDCQKSDFENSSNYKILREKISKEIEKKKFNKFSLNDNYDCVLKYNKDITNENLCKICNMRKSTNSDECDICSAFVKLGNMLTNDTKKINSKSDLHIDFCDIDVKLDEKIKSFVAKKGENIIEFFELADNELNALGILKADVDGMGNFIKESEVTSSFSSFDCFSKNIDAFFSLYLPKIIKEKFPNTYVVFAGGDDLFIIGEWKSALNLARRIRAEFKSFVENKKAKNLSISFGIAIAKHNTPIKYLAGITEELLDKSKEVDGKDAISMFNLSAKWQEYNDTFSKLQVLKNLKDDDKTAFFYRLLDLCDMRIKIVDNDFEPKDTMWRSKLHYSIERNIKESDKDALLELLNEQIEKHPKESKMVISEIIYTRREK